MSSTLKGIIIVTIAGFALSLGGAVSRYLLSTESWVAVFWRGIFAALFIFAILLIRDKPAGIILRYQKMGIPSLIISITSGISLVAFVVSLYHLTVASVVIIIATSPAIAALFLYIFYREKTPLTTWISIFGVFLGILIMVGVIDLGNFALFKNLTNESLKVASHSFVNPSVNSAIVFLPFVCAASAAIIAIVSRRNHQISMLPAMANGCFFAAAIALAVCLFQGISILPNPEDWLWLIVFGTINLGVGFSCFVIGAREIPATLTALILLIEPVFSPIWTWLIHNEVPAVATLIGGVVVIASIILRIIWQIKYR